MMIKTGERCVTDISAPAFTNANFQERDIGRRAGLPHQIHRRRTASGRSPPPSN